MSVTAGVVVVSILGATVRAATPLILAATGGLVSDLAGLVDIGLEGKMLAAAFAAAAVAAASGSAYLGLLAGIITSIATALLQGFASITQRGNQYVAGLAVNILASGLTATIGAALFGRGGQTTLLTGAARFSPLDLPFTSLLQRVPVVGPLYAGVISHNVGLVYVAFVAVAATAFLLYKTRFGLRVRAAGELPEAVDTAGISVIKLRYQALMFNGLFCGLAGTYLSVGQNGYFDRDMTSGRGYLALAALVFANWKPLRVFLTCLLFGLLGALQTVLQGTIIPNFGEVPVELIQALPYILTVVLLAGFMGRAVAPKAAGLPYPRDR